MQGKDWGRQGFQSGRISNGKDALKDATLEGTLQIKVNQKQQRRDQEEQRKGMHSSKDWGRQGFQSGRINFTWCTHPSTLPCASLHHHSSPGVAQIVFGEYVAKLYVPYISGQSKTTKYHSLILG